ncbi:hypothetical protein AAE478_006825 [Parahypoxylon ruwenzoriense]
MEPFSRGGPGLTGQKPIDPARRITPPEEDIRTRDEQPVLANEYKSPYDEAFIYIQEYRAWRNPCFSAPFKRLHLLEDYEKAFAMKISIGDWIKLYHNLNLDSEDNSAILPTNLRRRTRILFEQEFRSFGGSWSGSEKKPDLGIQVRNADNEMELKWVLEVGFSETYELLIRLWLQGSSQVSMVTIVKFCETPPYRSPLPIYNNETGEELDPRTAAGIPPDFRAIRTKDVILERQYGSATYKGFRWVEQISEVWMETWVPNEDGRAVQRGNPIDLMRADQVQLEFGDFFPPGYPQTITIDLEEFRSSLQDCIREMAVVRCQKTVNDYLKRHGEGTR